MPKGEIFVFVVSNELLGKGFTCLVRGKPSSSLEVLIPFFIKYTRVPSTIGVIIMIIAITAGPTPLRSSRTKLSG